MWKFLPFLFLGSVLSYPTCNDIYEQHAYFENERNAFNVPISKSPFDNEYLSDTTRFAKTTCMNGTDIQELTTGSCTSIIGDANLVAQSPTDRFPLFDSLIWRFTDMMWYLTGWSKIIEDGEHYWYYPNYNSNKTVFYLHGINAVNGFENVFMLRKFTKTATVYFSLYSPILYFDANYFYTHTYSQHIDNVANFIQRYKTDNTDIIGNSYGTIRITTICKRYPNLCYHMDHIILTDPLNINLPFSKMLDACLYGVFLVHPIKTPEYHKSVTINTLRLYRYYNGLYKAIDWYEWTIDSEMMLRYSKNMVLVIGNYDSFIDVDRESPAMKLCRVIYTNTQHGLVIFTDFMEQIYSM
jgi:hypothetical protein